MDNTNATRKIANTDSGRVMCPVNYDPRLISGADIQYDASIRRIADTRITRDVLIHDDADGSWAEVPSLPGCVTQGRTDDDDALLDAIS